MHTKEAKKHALAAKEDQQHKVNLMVMGKGITFLNDAIKEGNSGNLEAAQKAAKDAKDAIYNFEQAAK